MLRFIAYLLLAVSVPCVIVGTFAIIALAQTPHSVNELQAVALLSSYLIAICAMLGACYALDCDTSMRKRFPYRYRRANRR
jgi:hypothetical protein